MMFDSKIGVNWVSKTMTRALFQRMTTLSRQQLCGTNKKLGDDFDTFKSMTKTEIRSSLFIYLFRTELKNEQTKKFRYPRFVACRKNDDRIRFWVDREVNQV